MKYKLLFLVAVSVLLRSSSAQVVEQFTGTVRTSSNTGGPSFFDTPVGAQVSGTLILTPSTLGTPVTVSVGNEWSQSLPNGIAPNNSDSISALSANGAFTATNLQSVILGETYRADLQYGGGPLTTAPSGGLAILCSQGSPNLPVDLTAFPLVIPNGCTAGVDFNDNLNQSFMTIDLTNLSVAPPVSIASVEITQAIQQYQTIADLQAYLASHKGDPPVPIVSGKPAVMRVYFSTVSDSNPVKLEVSGVVNQSLSPVLQLNCTPANQRAHANMCPSVDVYFTPPSGNWTVTLALTDSSGNKSSPVTLNIASHDMAAIVLKGVPACDTNPQNYRCGNPFILAGLIDFVGMVMPTNKVTIDIEDSEERGADYEKLLNTNKKDIPEGPWLNSMVATFNSLYTHGDTFNDFIHNTRTVYAGVFPAILSNRAQAAPSGNALVMPERVTRLNTDVSDLAVAHEVGHTLGLRHTNENVPAPTTSSPPGCLAFDSEAVYDPGVWPYTTNQIQSSVQTNGPSPNYEYGFNIEGIPVAGTATSNSVLDAVHTFELMSYCVPDWISPINYKREFSLLGYTVQNSPSVVTESKSVADSASRLRRNSAPTLTSGLYWQVSGSIGSSGIQLDPIFEESTLSTTDQGDGNYSIQELDANGSPLFTRYFTPVQYEDDFVTPAITLDPVFSEWIPVTANVVSINIADPSGNILASLNVNRQPPTVSIVPPSGGFTGTGTQVLSWTITDPGVTSFESRVMYSSDNGATYTQLTQTDGNAYTVDFSKLRGASSNTALLMVYVSDGANTGSAVSNPFHVPSKPPSYELITSPQNGSLHIAANPVYLRGMVFDPDDGNLTGTSLQWSSDVQGALGTGSFLPVSLSPGTHKITLTGTDSDGNAATTSTTVTVVGGPPALNLTTSQISANCISATITASSAVQGAPLSLLQYSLDGGQNYTNVALTQLPLTFIVPGSGNINLATRVYDSSSQSNAKSTRLTIAAPCSMLSLTATNGAGQSALLGSAFAQPLTVLVKGASGTPAAGVTVTFAAPAAGASASLSATSATTASDGTASVTATANSTSGTYSVSASAPNSSAPAVFSLTNLDFQVAAAMSSLTVNRGAYISDTITLISAGTLTSPVSLSCSGLPMGATCSFAPASLSLQAAGTASSVLTISIPQSVEGSSNSRSAFAALGCFSFCFLVPLSFCRNKARHLIAICVIAGFIGTISGCGGAGFKPFSSSVTVTAVSGSVQRNTTITVMVQ